MKFSEVTVVRIYLTETGELQKSLLAKLHDEEKVEGVTVFREFPVSAAPARCIPRRCWTSRSTCHWSSSFLINPTR